ncbi:ribonuclease HII [bacterium I07]|nr:ribonuclease HII [bacterium I07]
MGYENVLWDRGYESVAGVDEAGRGPLAGPVVAGAVIFKDHVLIEGMNDSKKLTPRKREQLYHGIREHALAWATGIVFEQEIDRINIYQATLKAMRKAIGSLCVNPDFLLIDGHALPENILPQRAIPGGDRKCYSIAAASIVAKVTRDKMMLEYDEMFPQYGFAQHKGYGTKKHFEAIQQFGLCEIHRKSFHCHGWKSR